MAHDTKHLHTGKRLELQFTTSALPLPYIDDVLVHLDSGTGKFKQWVRYALISKFWTVDHARLVHSDAYLLPNTRKHHLFLYALRNIRKTNVPMSILSYQLHQTPEHPNIPIPWNGKFYAIITSTLELVHISQR